MMMAEHILVDTKDNITTITLNRPEVHNAFNEQVMDELTAAFEAAGKDTSVRAVVLRGNGKSFCAGGDLNWMRKSAEYSYDENVEDAMRLGKLLRLINFLPKPTIAAVHGSVFGGGVGLTACCDIAIAAPDAVFCLSEVRIGLIPSIIAPYVIAGMGERQARRYFMTAERFGADRAKEIGFVHETGDLDAELEKIIAAIKGGAPTAQARGKKLILDIVNRPIDDAMIKLTVTQIAEARAAEEGKDGLTSFLNKTEPAWRRK
jgi:methylglutaconyl-CoA hydratase